MNEIFKILLETDCVLLRRTRTRTRGTSRFHPRPPPRRKFSFFSSSCSREKSIESSREERYMGERKCRKNVSPFPLSLSSVVLIRV